VINAGVPSYTSPQVRAYLEELLARYEPRAVLVSVLWNDALFACIPNWLPDYLAAQQPAPWRQVLLRHSGLYRALAIDPPEAATSGPVDNEPALRYYAENLEAMVRDCRRAGVPIFFLRPSVDPSHIPPEGMKIWRRTVPPQEFMALLDQFVTRLESVAAREQVPIVRHRLCRADSTQSEFFLDPVHLTGGGNRILAEDVASALADGPGAIFGPGESPR
jgi:lysophospholipase L1-like esterase